jgi:hypothetical protein
LTQVTTSERHYDFGFAEDIQSESFPFNPGVVRSAETDAVAKAYLDARMKLYATVQPGRNLPDVRMSYSGVESVAEVTQEYVMLYPTTTQ